MANWHIDELPGHHHTRAEGRNGELVVRRERKATGLHREAARLQTEGIGIVTAPSDPKRDIERFLAMGGGSFAHLLDMVEGAQPPEASPMETTPQPLGSPTWLPADYQLEHDPDLLSLRRADGSSIAVFSARGATKEAILRAVEEHRERLPAYFGPEEYADSARRLVETRSKHSWERFLRTERRMLEARRNGRMAKALAWRLPGESQEELDKMASEDRRRAEEGLVELRSEQGKLSYKHVEQLCPEDRMDRIRAELARIEWLLERRSRRSLLQSAFFGQHQSRRSRNSA